jgi:hypothetical protein
LLSCHNVFAAEKNHIIRRVGMITLMGRRGSRIKWRGLSLMPPNEEKSLWTLQLNSVRRTKNELSEAYSKCNQTTKIFRCTNT